jgi:hypothetical protein
VKFAIANLGIAIGEATYPPVSRPERSEGKEAEGFAEFPRARESCIIKYVRKIIK